MSALAGDTKVFRGSSLEDVLARVRDELGPDAVVVRQREGVVGGIGGFFARRCIEVEAVPGWPTGHDDAVLTLPAHEATGLYGALADPDAPLAPPENPFMEALLDRAAAFDELFVPTEPVGLLPSDPVRATAPAEETALADRDLVREPGALDFERLVEEAVAAAAPALPPASGDAPDVPPATAAPTPPPLPAAPVRSPHDEFLETEAGVRVSLAQAGMSGAAIESVMERVRRHLHPLAPTASVRELARLALRAQLPAPLGWEGRRVIGFAGLDGAPAARAVAALAAAHAQAGMRVAVVAIGGGRPAARLAAHLVETEVDVLLARDLRDIEPALDDAGAAELVLAVAPSVTAADELSAAAAMVPLLALDPDELHLVLPAAVRAERVRHALDLVDAFLPVDCLLPCGAGLAEELGAAVGIALERRLALRWVATGTGALRAHPADPVTLAAAILP
jgi:hypothetical protein